MIFRVGMTGHRWNGLKEADLERLNAQVTMVLEHLQQTVKHADASASLHLLSPIAEGSDRIAAHAALKLGYKLHCILPFAKTIYEEDFESEASKQEFYELLKKADEVLKLPHQPTSSETRNAAYTAAGRKVTEESNVLLALWDGEEARGEGGTGQMVEEALGLHRLVIWIHAKAPHNIRLLKREGQKDLSALSGFIERILEQTKKRETRDERQ